MKDKSLSGLETDKIKSNFWTYVVLLSALGAMTFFGVCDPGGGMSSGPKGEAARVNGEVITRSEFNRAYRNLYEQYQRQFSDQFDPAAMRLAHSVMKNLVDDRAMYQKAVELGLRASDEELIKLLADAPEFKGEDGKFNADYFKRFLANQGYTEASFMEEIRRSVTVQKFQRFVQGSVYVSAKAAELDYRLSETKLNLEYLKFDPQRIDVPVSAADVDQFLASEDGAKKVKEYYEGNPREFNQEEQVKARHILVGYQGARNATADSAKRTKEEAQKRAEELRGRVTADGADFAAVARETTDEAPGKTSGGDLGWFARAAMVKEFSEAAFNLKAGEISGVVESPFGFHVIKVEDRREPKSTSLEQAQRQIAENLLKKEQRPKLAREQAQQVVAALKEGKDVSGLLSQHKVAWAETGEIAANASYVPGIGSSKELSDALVGLTKAGQVAPEALDIRGNLYIVRLKQRKDADLAQLDQAKRREMAQSASFSEGAAIYRAVEKQVTGELDKKNKVWMNPDYLALDLPRQPAAGSKPSS